MKNIFTLTVLILLIFTSMDSKVVETIQTDVAKKNLKPSNRGKWKVWGQVLDQNNKGINALSVQAYDKDLIYDDLLGTTKTDSNGNFEIYYNDRDFNDLIEKSPDLYLLIKNNKGKILYSSKKKVRFQSKKTEKFSIILKVILYPRIHPIKKKN